MRPLYDRWITLKQQHPRGYTRDIARLMRISEAELIHVRVGHDAWRLNGDIKDIFAALETVGETRCLCRNEYAVHEHVGRFENQHLNGHTGLILNPRGLDLRLFLHQWACAFHVRDETPRGERQSIQFFDHQGDALLKVYTTDNTNPEAWRLVLSCFTHADNPPLDIKAVERKGSTTTAEAHNVDAEWRAMTDVHQFFLLLERHRLTRQQAFCLVKNDLACRVNNDALCQLLNQAKRDGNAIMIFVGNRGCVQIFTGEVREVVLMENGINVFNPEFTLHLMGDAIAESWVTRKPTADGHVTSLELFAADGTQIAQIYGQRTEGQPEQKQWRTQVAALTGKGLAA